MPKTEYERETLTLAQKQSISLADKFMHEVQRLLDSGAVDRDDHHRGLLFGVALENVADGWLRGERCSSTYKNLKRF